LVEGELKIAAVSVFDAVGLVTRRSIMGYKRSVPLNRKVLFQKIWKKKTDREQ